MSSREGQRVDCLSRQEVVSCSWSEANVADLCPSVERPVAQGTPHRNNFSWTNKTHSTVSRRETCRDIRGHPSVVDKSIGAMGWGYQGMYEVQVNLSSPETRGWNPGLVKSIRPKTRVYRWHKVSWELGTKDHRCISFSVLRALRVTYWPRLLENKKKKPINIELGIHLFCFITNQIDL